MHLSIRWKLILSISIPLLLTYLGMLSWDYWRLREGAMEQMQDLVLERAQNLASGLNARLENVMQAADNVAAALGRQADVSEPQLRGWLASNLRPLPSVTATFVVIESPQQVGLVLRRGGGPRGIERADIDPTRIAFYSQIKSTGEPQWIGPHSERTVGEQVVCTYASPIVSNGVFRGIVAMNVAADELQGPRQRRPRRGGTTVAAATRSQAMTQLGADAVAVIDREGRVVGPDSATQRRTIFNWADENNLTEFIREFRAAMEGQSSVVRVPGMADFAPGFKASENYWIALAPISATGWVFTAAIPESQVMGPIIERLWHRAGFLLAGLLALLAIATLVSIRISRPIEKMASAVDQLALGNLDARVEGVNSRDELGALAGAFNLMTTQLKSHVAALTEQSAAREKVDAEMRIARKIQNDLLPRTFPPFPQRTEFDLYAVNVPALRVAGDFYDFFFTGDDLLTVVIADVSGKGVPAALLMAVTRTIVRNLASTGLSPAQIVDRANTMLMHDTGSSMFVTMFLCQFNTKTGHVTYVNAGHPRPYRIGDSGSPRQFGEWTAALMGVSPPAEIGPFAQREDRLEVGQTLFMYTDGVTEARAPDGRMLRDAGLEKLLALHGNGDVEQLCRRFVDSLNQYQQNQPADDITLVALRRRA